MKLQLTIGTTELLREAREVVLRLRDHDELDLTALRAALARVEELQDIVRRSAELAKIEPMPGIAKRARAEERAKKRGALRAVGG